MSAYKISQQQAREIRRYYADRAYRESLPCGECGAKGGCLHFPKEVAPARKP